MANSDIKFRLTASDQTQQAFASVQNRMESLGRTAATVRRGMETIGLALTVKEFVDFGKRVIDLGDEFNDMSVRTGVAVKTLASYKLAAEQSGTSLDLVAKGIQRLTLSIGQAQQGYKPQADSLRNLGISARNPQKAFEQLADAVAKSNDPTKLAADLNNLLGRSYNDLLPLLKEGSAYLRESADASATFAEQMAKLAPNADRFNDQLAEMKTHAAGLAAKIVSDLLPSLSQYVGAMNEITQHGSTWQNIAFFTTGYIPADVADNVTDYASRTAQLREEIKRLKDEGKDASEAMARLNKVIEAEVERQMHPPHANAGGSSTTTTNTTIRSDPLAGLLSQTEIGRIRAFDKTVALLNARFDGGRKNAELYAQAMTKLVQATFADRWKQAADDAEFFRAVEEDGIKTTQEWRQNLEDLANVDMGRLNDLLSNTDFARLKHDQEDMVLLARAFSEGIKDADGNLRKLSESEYLDAVKNRLGLMGEKINEMSEFAKSAAHNMQSAFADFLFDPFKDGLKGMVQGFGDVVRRMIAEATAARLAKSLFGDLVQGGQGSGLIGSALSFFAKSANGNAFDGGQLHAFASGGILGAGGGVLTRPTVFPMAKGWGLAGEAGTEAVMPLKRGSDGKLGVAGGSSSLVVNMTVNTPDADSFRSAKGHIQRQLAAAVRDAHRYT